MCVYLSLSLSRAGRLSSAEQQWMVLATVHAEKFKGTTVSYGAKVSLNHHRHGIWNNHTRVTEVWSWYNCIQSPGYCCRTPQICRPGRRKLKRLPCSIAPSNSCRGSIYVGSFQGPFHLVLVVLVVLLTCAYIIWYQLILVINYMIFCLSSPQCSFCVSRNGREESGLRIYQNLNLANLHRIVAHPKRWSQSCIPFPCFWGYLCLQLFCKYMQYVHWGPMAKQSPKRAQGTFDIFWDGLH